MFVLPFHRVLNNFVVWTVSYHMSKFLSWEYQKIRSDLWQATVNMPEDISVPDSCMALLKDNFPEPMAIEFLRIHTDDNTEKMVWY